MPRVRLVFVELLCATARCSAGKTVTYACPLPTRQFPPALWEVPVPDTSQQTQITRHRCRQRYKRMDTATNTGVTAGKTSQATWDAFVAYLNLVVSPGNVHRTTRVVSPWCEGEGLYMNRGDPRTFMVNEPFDLLTVDLNELHRRATLWKPVSKDRSHRWGWIHQLEYIRKFRVYKATGTFKPYKPRPPSKKRMVKAAKKAAKADTSSEEEDGEHDSEHSSEDEEVMQPMITQEEPQEASASEVCSSTALAIASPAVLDSLKRKRTGLKSDLDAVDAEIKLIEHNNKVMQKHLDALALLSKNETTQRSGTIVDYTGEQRTVTVPFVTYMLQALSRSKLAYQPSELEIFYKGSPASQGKELTFKDDAVGIRRPDVVIINPTKWAVIAECKICDIRKANGQIMEYYEMADQDPLLKDVPEECRLYVVAIPGKFKDLELRCVHRAGGIAWSNADASSQPKYNAVIDELLDVAATK